MSRGASSWRSWRCCVWITWRWGWVRCTLVGFWAVFFKSNIFTWSSTSAGSMSPAMSFSGSGSPSSAYAPIPILSSSPSLSYRSTSARCSSYGPLHSPQASSAVTPVLIISAWLKLRSITLSSSPSPTWPIFTGFISSDKVSFARSPSRSCSTQFIGAALLLESLLWTCDLLQSKDDPSYIFELSMSNCPHSGTRRCFPQRPKESQKTARLIS